MCCLAQHKCAVLHKDDFVELEDGEEHFADVERDGVTARDYMAQTYF
jgi:hypothetical protein